MLLSITVTVYNIEKYIGECLESLINQDFDDYEVIVVDNGSSDNSVKICEEYARKYPNIIRFYALTSPTINGRAYYVAREKARGVYVQHIDGDDYIAKGCLKQIANIIKDRKPDLIFGSFTGVFQKGGTGVKDAQFEEKFINSVSYDEALTYLSEVPGFHPVFWRYIFKKEINDYLYREEWDDRKKSIITMATCKDWEAQLELFCDSDSIYYYNGPFYFYRKTKLIEKMNYINPEEMADYVGIFFLMMSRIFEKSNNSAKLAFAESRLELVITNFIVSARYISLERLYLFSNEIKKYAEYISILDKCKNIKLQEIARFINTYGLMEGILLYSRYEEGNFLRNIIIQNNKEIYIFPTGIKGQMTAKLLMDNKYNVKGFIDNDLNKAGFFFEGKKCFLIKEINKNAIVVVAPLYRSLMDVMKKQLIDNGIKEENIIIRE